MSSKFNINLEAAYDKTNRFTVFVLFICGSILASVYVPNSWCQMIAMSDLNKLIFILSPIALALVFGTSLFGVLLLSADTFIFGIIGKCFAGLFIQQILSGGEIKYGLLLVMLICFPVFFLITVFGIGFADGLVEASSAHTHRMSFLPMLILFAAAAVSGFYIIG